MSAARWAVQGLWRLRQETEAPPTSPPAGWASRSGTWHTPWPACPARWPAMLACLPCAHPPPCEQSFCNPFLICIAALLPSHVPTPAGVAAVQPQRAAGAARQGNHRGACLIAGVLRVGVCCNLLVRGLAGGDRMSRREQEGAGGSDGVASMAPLGCMRMLCCVSRREPGNTACSCKPAPHFPLQAHEAHAEQHPGGQHLLWCQRWPAAFLGGRQAQHIGPGNCLLTCLASLSSPLRPGSHGAAANQRSGVSGRRGGFGGGGQLASARGWQPPGSAGGTARSCPLRPCLPFCACRSAMTSLIKTLNLFPK